MSECVQGFLFVFERVESYTLCIMLHRAALTQVSCPALAHRARALIRETNDFKVKWFSGVHDNIFRQTTVVNHL